MLNNVNNTKNAINSSNEVNAGSVTKKIDEAATTKVDVDADGFMKIPEGADEELPFV